MPSSQPSDRPITQVSPLSPASILARLTSGVILLNVFVLTLVGLSIQQSHRQYQERAEITTQNLTQTLESEIVGAVKTDDVALFAVIDEYKREYVDGGVDEKMLNAYIDRVRWRMPEIDALRITDAQGVLVYGNGVMPATKTSLADRPHFIRLRDAPLAGLVISKPQLSRVNQKWVIVLARRIDQPDGSFGGMVFAAITLEHFSKAFSVLNIGPHAAVALRDEELGLIVRYPELQEVASTIGNKPVAGKFREMVAAGNTSGTFTVHAGSDNVERTYSFHKVGSYPLNIIVGLAPEDYLAEWRDESTKQAALAALFALMTFLAAWLIYRIWKRQVNSVEALVRQEAKFHTVADFTFDWEYWQGPQKEILYMTPSCERVTSYTREEFIADPILLLRVIHPEDRHVMDRHLHDIAHPIDSQDGAQVDFRIVRRDGEIRWIAHGCRAIFGQNGEYMGRRVGNRDITERKQIEEAREEALSRLHKIASQVPGIVFQFRLRADGSSCVPYASEALREIYRVSPDEVRNDASPVFSVVHPDDLPAHLASIEASAKNLFPWQHEYRLKFAGESDIWLLGKAIPQQEADGSVLWHGFVTDITERKAVENRIAHLAHHDALTGLLNRLSLMGRLEQALATVQREHHLLAVMFIDMDRFKTINDTLGHAIGDGLLVEVARRLGDVVRNSDIVARLGGDEFVVVLTEVEGAAAAARVADKILISLGQSYLIGEYEVHSTPSIGLAFYPTDGEDSETLMKNADTAMYHAKSQGRNNVQFFAREMNLIAMKRLRLEYDMREALATGQFELQYQPQLDSLTGRFVGVEALLRWRNPQGELVLPADFIQVAEECGLILPLGEWVLDEACRQLRDWRDRGVSDIGMAVNLSALQLRSPALLTFIALTLEKHGLTGADLELEITESALMDNPKACIGKLKALCNMGVKLSIDDFGTGYSSLSYLKLMPIHTLKVDQSFVRDIGIDANDVAICTATIALAHNLGLSVVAEGVETEAQRDFLIAQHCDLLQGFLFSKPVGADAVLAFFHGQKH